MIFFVSDHHFGHANILKFKRLDGVTPVRSFSSVEEMNEHMIQQHNKVVGDDDDVYFGGDVTFDSQTFHRVMPRLKGKKRLILGNHDHLRMDEYYRYFENIKVSRLFNGKEDRLKKFFRPDDKPFLLTHYPIHIASEKPNRVNNVHGHIHEKQITTEVQIDTDLIITTCDRRYLNISVENLNYTPISIEDILEYFR